MENVKNLFSVKIREESNQSMVKGAREGKIKVEESVLDQQGRLPSHAPVSLRVIV